MNVVVVLLVMLGGFLIMDAVGERRASAAEREAGTRVKYVPLSMLEEQLSGASTRDRLSDMFLSSGPWGFRDDFGGIARDTEAAEEDAALDLAFSELQRNRTDLTSSPGAVAAERRRVEERIRARFDELAEDRLRRRAGLSASDPLFETYASVPTDHVERRAARRRRSAARRSARGGSG